LKAKFCVEGNHLLYEYCHNKGIDYKRIGKLIIANDLNEKNALNKLFLNGIKNGVDGLSVINKREIINKEPNLNAKYAIFSETTGIIDSHAFALSLEAEIENFGSHIILDSPVLDGVFNGASWDLDVGGSSDCIINCDLVVNAAGFNAQMIATKFGLENTPPPVYVKGHYYKLLGKSPFNHLIYPIPNKFGLGIHTSLDMSDNLKFGPDAELIDSPDYKFMGNEDRKAKFIKSIASYLNDFNIDLIQEDYCGVRVRLHPDHHLSDFHIQYPSDHGMTGLVNLFGIESPGLTSSLAIADTISNHI
jgi:L-2-hydroxyglutarate oxidase LhgO